MNRKTHYNESRSLQKAKAFVMLDHSDGSAQERIRQHFSLKHHLTTQRGRHLTAKHMPTIELSNIGS